MKNDSLIQYGDKNILEFGTPVLTDATFSGDTYTINSGGTVKYELTGRDISMSAKNIMFDYIFNSNDDYYGKNVGFNVYLTYSDYTDKIDKFTLNMYGFEATAKGLLGGNEINTMGYSFTSIVVEIFNDSASTLVVKDLKVLKSIDYQRDQIVEVIQQDSVSIDTIMAKSAWIENLQVEVLETNTKAKSVKFGSSENRDFITIKDNSIKLGVEELENEQYEQLNLDIDGVPTPVWYTAINDNKYAYKFITINHPRDYLPDITDEEIEAYKYMVYKSKGTYDKMKIEIVDGNPKIVFGVGTTMDTDSMRGKGVIQKDTTTLKVEKYNDNREEVSAGIYMQDVGSHLKGFDTLPKKVEINNNSINVTKADGTSIGFNIITDGNGNIKALESSTGKVIQFVVNI